MLEVNSEYNDTSDDSLALDLRSSRHAQLLPFLLGNANLLDLMQPVHRANL